jgi:tetratricopeptide (TPR) repeat protein
MKATLALTLLLLCTGGLHAQARLMETFNKAILEEESQHNLPAAVADYQQVVAAFDEDRKAAAAALFRLAECQRKLHHDDQAKAAYERVVREFADQGAVVEQSSTILAATYGVRSSPLAPGGSAIDSDVENARQRYRNALKDSITQAQSNQARIEGLVRQGSVGPEAVDDARKRTLKLQRELSAFNMGLLPAK